MKRVLFIDGSNLYAGQFELFGPNNYLNGDLFLIAIQKLLKTTFDQIFIYGSFSPIPKRPSKKAKLQIKNEGLFYKSIRRNSNVSFFKGYRSPSSGKEKEVDVKLAVDIVDKAHRNEYDELYLLSGDADFMHALHIAKERRKKITILALPNRIPFRYLHHFETIIFGNVKQIKRHSTFSKKTKTQFIELDYSKLTEKC